MGDGNLDLFIKSEIANNNIVIFSKSFCPYCMRVRKIFEEKKVKCKVIELDQLGEMGRVVQQRLSFLTGQKTVPSVFIHGNHVGGCTHLEELEACCVLDEMIEGTVMDYDYDVVVIGGGSGGLAAAKELGRLGKRVALCDYVVPSGQGTSWGLGGTCTNVGCIPKKLMHLAALAKNEIQDAPYYGWDIQPAEVKFDWGRLVSGVQDHIKSLNWRSRKELVSLGIKYLNGLGSFVNNHTVTVTRGDDVKTLTCQNVLIAVGGRPKYLDISGAAEYCITSDDLFSLPEFPDKVLIIGASYVGLEVASFLSRLGATVTVLVRSVVLRGKGFDREVVDRLKDELDKQGVNFLYGAAATKVSKHGDLLKVDLYLQDETSYSEFFKTVMLAIGRVPSTRNLNVENAGIKLCNNGKIPTNEKDQTVVKNIFAIGDCANNRPELTPVAIQAARLLAKRLCRLDCQSLTDYRTVPKTVFTWPEYGCVGESEESAADTFGRDQTRVYQGLYRPVESALTLPTSRCFAKVITVLDQADQERIVGMHLLGGRAGEVVQGFALAVKLRATKQDLDSLIAIHPTCAQVFTMLQASKAEMVLELGEMAC